MPPLPPLVARGAERKRNRSVCRCRRVKALRLCPTGDEQRLAVHPAPPLVVFPLAAGPWRGSCSGDHRTAPPWPMRSSAGCCRRSDHPGSQARKTTSEGHEGPGPRLVARGPGHRRCKRAARGVGPADRRSSVRSGFELPQILVRELRRCRGPDPTTWSGSTGLRGRNRPRSPAGVAIRRAVRTSVARGEWSAGHGQRQRLQVVRPPSSRPSGRPIASTNRCRLCGTSLLDLM
jgi:hypothetical protein